MGKKAVRIGIVAPSSPFSRDTAERVTAFAATLFSVNRLRLDFHPQCFLRHNHFAGEDAARTQAFVDYANDADYDAVWLARGGYGACRIAAPVLGQLSPTARDKTYLGYSDGGTLLAGLYGAGYSVAHGPMCQDITREHGEIAVERALRWLVDRDPSSLEPSLADGRPAAAFNLTVLSQLIGTPLQPDLRNHVLILEEVSEYLYAIDRAMHHVTANPALRKVAGIRLGRCSDILENDVDFGMTPEQIVRHWCSVSGIAWLGHADIGHDTANTIVPFG